MFVDLLVGNSFWFNGIYVVFGGFKFELMLISFVLKD